MGEAARILAGIVAGIVLGFWCAPTVPQFGAIDANNLRLFPSTGAIGYALPQLDDVSLPPVEMRGDARVIVEFINPQMMEVVCGEWTTACTHNGVIRMPNPCKLLDFRYANLMCHELGHVMGWTHPEEDAESRRLIDAYKAERIRRCHAPLLCGDRL